MNLNGGADDCSSQVFVFKFHRRVSSWFPGFLIDSFGDHESGVLADDERYRGKTKKQRSGMTTRSLRLLRDHGVIRRLPKARRYQLTSQGRQLVTTLQAALAASTEQLMDIAA